MSEMSAKELARALWRIHQRPEQPTAWIGGGNLPWNDPEFSRRMLREHLDESHGAASRQTAQRKLQVEWLWDHLNLAPGGRVLDITCGPGLYAVELAARGCQVTGIDFSPASITYARKLAQKMGVDDRCTFIEGDIRQIDFPDIAFDAALFLYGQLAVFPADEAMMLLEKSAGALRPGARLVVEILDRDKVDKKPGNWWFTGETGLWGDAPFLHLGERFWLEEDGLSIERFSILHLETGKLDEIILCDQTYSIERMSELLAEAGYASVTAFSGWDGVPLYDAEEWVVFLAEVASKG